MWSKWLDLFARIFYLPVYTLIKIYYGHANSPLIPKGSLPHLSCGTGYGIATYGGAHQELLQLAPNSWQVMLSKVRNIANSVFSYRFSSAALV